MAAPRRARTANRTRTGRASRFGGANAGGGVIRRIGRGLRSLLTGRSTGVNATRRGNFPGANAPNAYSA